MPWLVHKGTGERYWVEPDNEEATLSTGEYERPEGYATIRTPAGNVREVHTSDLDRAVGHQGAEPATTAEAQSAERSAQLEDEHGGIVGNVVTALEGGADALTFGAYSGLARLVAPDYAEEIGERADENPIAAGAGEVGAAIGSGGATLARTPAGVVVRGAKSLGGKAGKKAGSVVGAGVQYGVEGGAFGAGAGVREVALSEDPVTLEAAVSTISSRALLGGGLGVAGGVTGKALEKGLGRAKRAIEKARTSRKAAEEAGETEVVEQLAEYNRKRDPAFRIAKREAGSVTDNPLELDAQTKRLMASKRSISRELGTPDYLAKNPKSALKPLAQERKVLEELSEEIAQNGEDGVILRLSKGDEEIAESIRKRLAKAAKKAKGEASEVALPKNVMREWRDWRGVAGKQKNLSIGEAEDFLDALESGAVNEQRRQAIRKIPELLQENLDVQAAIEEATERIRLSKQQTLGGSILDQAEGAGKAYALSAVTGFAPGGPLGMVAGLLAPPLISRAAKYVAPRMGRAAKEVGNKLERGVDALLSTGQKASRAVGPGAARVLSQVQFAEREDEPQPKGSGGRTPKLADVYSKRADELFSQVTLDPAGQIRMTPQARAKVHERLAGVRAFDPVLADRMETMAARRVEFLAGKLPKQPDVAGPKWRPSDMQIREFARAVRAVEEPAAVIERASSGNLVPVEVEALKTVYPALYSRMRREVAMRLPELRDSLPSQKRIILTLLTGIPVEPSLDPRILRQTQGAYKFEPGTEGGTRAPTPQPQFGSVKAPEPTPAQDRANPEARS